MQDEEALAVMQEEALGGQDEELCQDGDLC